MGLAHADAFTNIVGAATSVVDRTGGQCVTILGGQPESIDQLLALKQFLDGRGITSEWDIFNGVKSIAIDKESGEITNRKLAPESR